MPRLAQYLGRWIYHSGWYPDRKVRLYDRRKAKWVGDFVHESVQPQGTRRPPGKQHPALHLRFALRASARPWTAIPRSPRRNWRASKVHVPLWSLILDPPWNFVKAYVFQRGFLDGLEGLIISYMAAFYTFLKYSKARNMS